MTEQTSLWQNEQHQQQSSDFAELCNALYERELSMLAQMSVSSPQAIQGRLRSLPHYIKRTAHLMMQTQSPLTLDVQNASWSAKQGLHIPLSHQELASVNQWYLSITLSHGLVVPIDCGTHIALDSIDRIDADKQRFRTNAHGWFNLSENIQPSGNSARLLKPNKKTMVAACTGHRWLNDHKANPVIPSLRELLLSCAINWQNFKKPLTISLL
jgi:hypothetical protein